MLLGRRSWIKTTGALALGSSLPAAPAAQKGDSLIASSSVAVTETASGKVRGFVHRGVYTFRGIPYAAPTSGERRFMPPVKPAPWKGVRSSLTYGYVSPQEPRTIWSLDELAFVYQWDDGFQHEDCLRVNIWTQGLDNRERPVMVWLHGGGFSTGSGHEMKTYDGENLARRGDVVVVSLNHRVGAVGFLNLASLGDEKYAASANLGMLDIIAALEWVRDNIRNWRSRQCDRVRSVRWRRQSHGTDGHAASGGALPQSHCAERLYAANARSGEHREAGDRGSEGTGGRKGEPRSAINDAGRAHRCCRSRGRERAIPAGRQFQAVRIRAPCRTEAVGADSGWRYPPRISVLQWSACGLGEGAAPGRLDTDRSGSGLGLARL